MQCVVARGIISFQMKNYPYERVLGAGRAVELPSMEELDTLPRDESDDLKKDPIGQYKDVLNLLAEIIADDIIARGKNND